MAIQLSSWLCLRNNELRHLCEDRHHESGISDSDKQGLARIMKKIDFVHCESDFERADEVIKGANFAVPVTARYVEFSIDKTKSQELFLGIHKVLQKYWLRSDIYRGLGRAHEEIEIKPKTRDFANAIKYMTMKYNKAIRALDSPIDRPLDTGVTVSDTFCWQNIRKDFSQKTFDALMSFEDARGYCVE
ncbi:MAG: hypothetical protein Q8L27_01240 [archaeon]|nr:hypothetical protein [archaeon]